MAALLSLAKPATLSPQPTLSDPSLAEQERAGPRRVQPEKGSKEARRREYAASERQGRSTGPHASPCPPSCSFSSSDEHPHSSSSAAAGRDGSSTPTLSSSSSVRTPSPANSLNHPTTPSSSSFSAHVVEEALPTAPPTPATAAASSSQYFSTVSLMLEEPHAALPKALWKADADADVCDRDGCTVRFGMFTARKHHCRKCGLIFCSACTAETHPLLFPRTLASALTSPLQSRNTSPSSSYSTITSLMPAAAASSSSSSSRPPSPPLSDCGSGVPTPTPTSAANPATPTRQVAVVTSRVCLDCKKSLSSPASMRPTIASRRSSTRSSLRPSGGGPSTKELQPLHSLAEALQLSGIGSRGGLDSPDFHRSRNRSLSPASTLFPSASANTSPRLSSALPPLGSAASNASTSSLPRLNLASLPSPSPFASTRSPAVTPHEPWMDGPLGEFPLAYPRRDGPLFDPSVHQAVVRSRSQLRMKSRSREGSLVGDSVKEDEVEDPQRVGRWGKGSQGSAGSQRSSPSQSSISPESNSTGPASAPDEEEAGAHYNWSTF